MISRLWVFDQPEERLPSWERRFRGRMLWEVSRLQERGRILGVLNAAWNAGLFALDYEWMHAGLTYSLRIIYPFGFPWRRPDVFLIGDRRLFPRRHCDPLTGRLCYLGQQKHAWGPQSSIAELIDEQLPKIVTGDGRQDEDAVGEPAENWWNSFSTADSIFVVDSEWNLGNNERGTIRLKLADGSPIGIGLRAVCTAIYDQQGVALEAWTRELPLEFSSGKEVTVPWVRLKDELFPRDFEEGFQQARSYFDGLKPRSFGSRPVEIFAVVFPTELTHGRIGDSWVLFIRAGSISDFRAGRETRLERVTARTLRAGRADRASRAPSASALKGKRVLLVGVGAIGAEIAVDLARNGVKALGLVDGDIMTPGNGVRWLLGESAWGRLKVEALKAHMSQNYSDVHVDTFPQMVGMTDLDAPGGLGTFMTSSDIVIDATSAFDTVSILADQCSRLGMPLISVNGTATLEGGIVARYMPNGGCPTCLVFHQRANSSAISPPPGDDGNPMSVPLPGCAEATFAGASFDLGELSLQAVRATVRALQEESGSSVVERLEFAGQARLPSWSQCEFAPHPSCGCRQ